MNTQELTGRLALTRHPDALARASDGEGPDHGVVERGELLARLERVDPQAPERISGCR